GGAAPPPSQPTDCFRSREPLGSRESKGVAMDIGCQLPMQGPVATRDALVTFARQAEAHGMASLWVSDHVVFPYTSSGYPGGRFPHPPENPYLAPVTLLAG